MNKKLLKRIAISWIFCMVAVLVLMSCSTETVSNPETNYETLVSQSLSSLTIEELQWLADYCMKEANRYRSGNIGRTSALSMWANRAVAYQTQILINIAQGKGE